MTIERFFGCAEQLYQGWRYGGEGGQGGLGQPSLLQTGKGDKRFLGFVYIIYRVTLGISPLTADTVDHIA